MRALAGQSRLFLDASVLIAAAASSEGGSALVLALCQAGKAEALVTRLVLREVERNLRDKFDDEILLRFYRLIADLEPELIPVPSPGAMEEAARVVDAKDAHVLAVARLGEATRLITLDRKHFLRPDQRRAMLPIQACTPKEFLRGEV